MTSAVLRLPFTVDDLPIVLTQDITVQLNANGAVTIIPAQINNVSTDNCTIDSYALDITDFTCTDVGSPVTVTLTITDVNGNSDSATVIVKVEDNANSNCASLGVSDFNLPKVLLYPNPTKDSFTINGLENTSTTLQTFTTQGQIVKTIFNYISGDISIKNLANGVYFIKIITDETSQTKSLLKNN